MIVLRFDGSSAPDRAGWGIVVEEDNVEVHAEARVSRDSMTVNQAEYAGLILGLEFCLDQGYRSIEVCGDSQVVIYQMLGKYQVTPPKPDKPGLTEWHGYAKELAAQFDEIEFRWRRRKYNGRADAVIRKRQAAQ